MSSSPAVSSSSTKDGVSHGSRQPGLQQLTHKDHLAVVAVHILSFHRTAEASSRTRASQNSLTCCADVRPSPRVYKKRGVQVMNNCWKEMLASLESVLLPNRAVEVRVWVWFSVVLQLLRGERLVLTSGAMARVSSVYLYSSQTRLQDRSWVSL